MTLVLGGFCRIGAGAGGGGGPFGSGKRYNCSKLQNIINNEKHCNHSTARTILSSLQNHNLLGKECSKEFKPLEPKHAIYEVETNWLWFATILLMPLSYARGYGTGSPQSFVFMRKTTLQINGNLQCMWLLEAKFLNQRVQEQDPVSTMQKTGWTYSSSLV